MIRKVYAKMWKHGGEFEAPPGEIRRVMCKKTGGVFVLNTVCLYLLNPHTPNPPTPPLPLRVGMKKKKRKSSRRRDKADVA